MSEFPFQNSSNIIYELTQKNDQIDSLINENNKYSELVNKLKSEIFTLKGKLSTFSNLPLKLKSLQEKNAELENKVQKLTKEILIMAKKCKDENRLNERKYLEEIKKLKSENDGFKTKIEMTNHLANENNGLINAFDKIIKDKNDILLEQDKKLRENKIHFQLKIADLKKKMLNTVNETQGKVNELNMQYADINTKLAKLQNQQTIIKYQYQSKLFNELAEKNKILETDNFQLKKQLEIHKEVELSLAEKYKKLKENNDLKNADLTSSNNSFRKLKKNLKGKPIKKIPNINGKILFLKNGLLNKKTELEEKKIINDSIQKQIKEKEKKYLGIYNYLEECLKLFFKDDYLKSKKNIYIHIDEIKKGDFSQLSKEEKYAILNILMKYLMTLIYHDKSNIKTLNNSCMKFKLINKENNIKYLFGNSTDMNKSSNLGKKILKKKIFTKNEKNLELPFNFSYNSFDNSLSPTERLSFISTKKTKIL